jgi:hypothetical protein
MTQAVQFATAGKFNQSSRKKHFSADPELHSLFEDLLLDDGFDKIGRLDYDGPEFDMYRELHALPRE